MLIAGDIGWIVEPKQIWPPPISRARWARSCHWRQTKGIAPSIRNLQAIV